MKSIHSARVVWLVLLAATAASIVTTRAAATPLANPGTSPQAMRFSQPTLTNIGVIGTGTLGSPGPGAAPAPSKPAGQ